MPSSRRVRAEAMGPLLLLLSPVSFPLDLFFCRREVSLSSGFGSGRSRGISYNSESGLVCVPCLTWVLASKPLVVTHSPCDTPAGAGTQPARWHLQQPTCHRETCDIYLKGCVIKDGACFPSES